MGLISSTYNTIDFNIVLCIPISDILLKVTN
jgi:hypothetical protein